jgi:hypothetical protein
VVLVDEYDKPILDNITDHPTAREMEVYPQGRALQQIKDRGYADKYRAGGQPIHLIGIEFSRERHTLVGFEVETGIHAAFP